jgi:hypothetical protein
MVASPFPSWFVGGRDSDVIFMDDLASSTPGHFADRSNLNVRMHLADLRD